MPAMKLEVPSISAAMPSRTRVRLPGEDGVAEIRGIGFGSLGHGVTPCFEVRAGAEGSRLPLGSLLR
jgi:hypothetical protein